MGVPKAKCPSCATVVSYAEGYDPICPQCGFRGAAPAVPKAPPAAWSPVAGDPMPMAPAQPVYAPAVAAGYVVQPGRQQGMAVAALVCGVIALLIPPAGIAAIILGVIALSQADRDPMRYGGKGMAIAGIVLGILFFFFGMSMFGGMGMWDDDFWWDW